MKPWTWIALAVAAVFLARRASSTSAPSAQSPTGPSGSTGLIEIASFYGPGYDGKLTASGEVFHEHALTAAHRTLPFGAKVRVTDVDNGRNVVVKINDRGPFAKKNGVYSRSIDLSVGAAAVIGLDIKKGLARVRLERVS